MTARKENLCLPARTPAYVDRETGAAELVISPQTWDEWVKEGAPPLPGSRFPTFGSTMALGKRRSQNVGETQQ